MVNILSIIGKTFIGATILAAGLAWYSQNTNFSSIENAIIQKKSRMITQQIKNKKPNKKILYLISHDFEISYEAINYNFKNKFRLKYKIHKQKYPGQCLTELESIINNFNLDKNSFNTHLGDLNLIDHPFGGTFIIRENKKDSKVYVHKFRNQNEFFKPFLDENTKDFDEVIIYAHGKKAFIGCDLPGKAHEVLKFFDPRNYITVLDIKMMSEETVGKIRSKLNKNAVIYLQSCEALKNHENQTTIAEALAYLFQRPVVASVMETMGWPIDAHPYDKINLSKPEMIKEENVSYKANCSEGKWFIIYPNQ